MLKVYGMTPQKHTQTLFFNSYVLVVFSKHDHECVKTSFGNPGGFHHMTQDLCKRAVASPLLLSEEYGSKPLLSLSFFRLFCFQRSFFHLLGRVTPRDNAEPRWGENDEPTTCLYLRISLCIYVGVHSELHVHVCMKGRILILVRARKKDYGHVLCF